MAAPIEISPPCSVCLQDDRMVRLEPTVVADFGGIVEVHVCQRCGVSAILTSGTDHRPSGGNGNVSLHSLYRKLDSTQ